MKKKQDVKTNAMRALDDADIPYEVFSYDTGGKAPSGVQAAQLMGLPPEIVFKTLVTKGRSGDLHVFVIPGGLELDLKKAAAAVGEKSVEMIPQKELVGRTGYVHGGCSPLAMKKQYDTVLDASAEALEAFLVSGGKIGVSIRLDPRALADLLGGSFHDVTRGAG